MSSTKAKTAPRPAWASKANALSRTGPAREELAKLEALITEANRHLESEAMVPLSVEANVARAARKLLDIGESEIASLHPTLAAGLTRGAITSLLALRQADPSERRDQLRVGLEMMRQSLRDIRERAPVADNRSPKEIARWLLHTLDASVGEVAEILDVPPRTLQRWISPTEHGSPKGDDVMRLQVLAQITNHLRHSFTGRGVMIWIKSPHIDLKDKTPASLLRDPEYANYLAALASNIRASVAS